MSWWRPWSWFRRPTNGHAAAAAEREAQRKLNEVKARWPEVYRATDNLSAAVTRAMRGNR